MAARKGTSRGAHFLPCGYRSDINLYQRRRKKFVRPLVQRLHPSGSAYSLPGMLAAGDYRQQRRSRAFSIESASTYAPISFENEGNISLSSPERYPNADTSRYSHHRQESSTPDTSQLYGDSSESAAFLPAGAAPYRGEAYRVPAVSSGGHSHVSTPSGHSELFTFGSTSSGDRDDGDGPLSSVTDATSILPRPDGDARMMAKAQTYETDKQDLVSAMFLRAASSLEKDPFYSHKSPLLPNSPTLRPTLLQRRTTDPFVNKHSLRIVNPDVRNTIPDMTSPSLVPSRPATPASVLTTEDELIYDNTSSRNEMMQSMRLDIEPRRGSVLTDHGSVYTPNQVNDVGFFRGD